MTSPVEVRFLSGNQYKVAEAVSILGAVGVKVRPLSKKIEELQTADTAALVKDKLLRAFRIVGRPMFVEHTGLQLEHLNGFPGGLTEVFWETLKADRFSELYGKLAPNTKAKAETVIGYCDGRELHLFYGAVDGNIVDAPRGPRDFQWDCVFQPSGEKETFAEMGIRKNDVSMRRKALDQFARFLGRI